LKFRDRFQGRRLFGNDPIENGSILGLLLKMGAVLAELERRCAETL